MKHMTDAHVHLGKRGDFDEKKETEALLNDMDKNNVEKAFLLPIGCSIERNEQVLASASTCSERLIPFVWLQPGDQASFSFFEKELKAGKIGGLKLHPYAGKYKIDDFPLLEPWMKLAEENSCHVIIHCTSGDPYCSPIQLEKLAVRYPGITFQMAHLGAIWQCDEGIEVVGRNENLYADTSIVSYSALLRAGMKIPDRLLLGTDYPFYRFEMEHLKLRLAVEDENSAYQIGYQNFMKLYHRIVQGGKGL